MSSLLVVGLICIGLGVWLNRRRKAKEARQALLQTPLSDVERKVTLEQVPLLQKMPSDLRAKLEGKMNLFLDQVEFIGCNGLEITEEMELSIAAQACLLVVNTDAWYVHLRTVLVYPGAFKSMTIATIGSTLFPDNAFNTLGMIFITCPICKRAIKY